MRVFLATLPVLVGLLACSDPPTDPSSEVLASTTFDGGCGFQGVAEMRFSLSIVNGPLGPDTIFATRYALFDEAAIRDGDDGTTLVAKAGTNDFAPFAAYLTDGTDDPITTTITCGGGGGGSTINESNFLRKSIVDGPRLRRLQNR